MNKQVCTNIEQSKKLLELGLDESTADMWYHPDFNYMNLPDFSRRCGVENIPAWSLGALMDLLPPVCKGNLLQIKKTYTDGGRFYFAYANLACYLYQASGATAFEAAFNMVCWLLKENLLCKSGSVSR